MNNWLIKSEPSVYKWEDLEKDGKVVWDGVRNYAARNHLRAMKKGDLAFFYHSNEGLNIVGIAEVFREHYPDPTARDGDWSAVDFKPYKRLKTPVTLAQMKKDPGLSEMVFIKVSRLSVSPVTEKEYKRIISLSTDV
jgi:predicted RNA-binding protein with PUA-like domain